VSATEVLMEVRDLEKYFALTRGIVLARKAGAVKAVDGVSFEVMKGETLGIVGETGCGKSTTARLMMRLLEPTAGTVRFEGNDITHLKGRRLKAVRRELQMVFQDPYSSLNPRKTVGSIVAEPFVIHGLHSDRAQRRERVKELMDTVGLNPEHYNRYPHEFSGGQRQRIGVARALALGPKLLIADEPTTALDVTVQAQILALLERLRGELGMAVMIVTHDMGVVAEMADEIAVMYAGRIVETAATEALLSRPEHPYTWGLLRSIPKLDGPRVERLEPIKGSPPSLIDPPSGCHFHPRCAYALPEHARIDPELRPLPADPAHKVACLLEPQVRRKLWEESA